MKILLTVMGVSSLIFGLNVIAGENPDRDNELNRDRYIQRQEKIFDSGSLRGTGTPIGQIREGEPHDPDSSFNRMTDADQGLGGSLMGDH